MSEKSLINLSKSRFTCPNSGKDVRLIPDILQIIFTKLTYKDLFSVIRVNRTWCLLGIPIFWKAPFSHRHANPKHAIRTYLLSNTELSINYLKMIPYLPENTILPENLERFEEPDIDFEIITKPLFDYVSYCLVFDYNGIFRAVLGYCETLDQLCRKNTAKRIMKILLEMFKSRGHQFKNMRVKYEHHDNNILSKYTFLYSEIDTLNLVGLHVDKSKVLAALIPLCRKIKHLSITMKIGSDELKNLIELIRGQTNLTTIEIIGKINDHRKSLLSALCAQKNTITSMEFSYFPFEGLTDWTIFRQFTRLKRLKIYYFSKTDIDDDALGVKYMEKHHSSHHVHRYGSFNRTTFIPAHENDHERAAELVASLAIKKCKYMY
ncbi:7932_t:CDS:2 [Ambispora gerdemannii]|uniref:7932_t:CDS:1 n=1 Tax=Ambispora gerdemannii TaxID=144530 RepID=A0A9N9FR12_9GLOM|nr:7932_t:CDS:2 [Ambispora gerdemannii]